MGRCQGLNTSGEATSSNSPTRCPRGGATAATIYSQELEGRPYLLVIKAQLPFAQSLACSPKGPNELWQPGAGPDASAPSLLFSLYGLIAICVDLLPFSHFGSKEEEKRAHQKLVDWNPLPQKTNNTWNRQCLWASLGYLKYLFTKRQLNPERPWLL